MITETLKIVTSVLLSLFLSLAAIASVEAMTDKEKSQCERRLIALGIDDTESCKTAIWRNGLNQAE